MKMYQLNVINVKTNRNTLTIFNHRWMFSKDKKKHKRKKKYLNQNYLNISIFII